MVRDLSKTIKFDEKTSDRQRGYFGKKRTLSNLF